MRLGLPEWTALAVIAERPTHGFAIAALTGRRGELGRIWHIPRPVVYRALGRLTDLDLITPQSVQTGRGPQRTLYAVTATGRDALTGWLSSPVGHVRDISHLLLKLALLHRCGTDPTALLRRQRATLQPILEALRVEPAAADGFDTVLRAWRSAHTAAALDFLDDVTREEEHLSAATTTEIIVRAVIRRDGQLLLARLRNKSWSFLPGGHVEPGERLEVALVREIAEELGTEVKVAGFVGVVEHGYVEDKVTHHELNLVFEVAIPDIEPVSQEDHQEFHWLPLEALADTDVRPGALKEALLATGDDRSQFWYAWNG